MGKICHYLCLTCALEENHQPAWDKPFWLGKSRLAGFSLCLSIIISNKWYYLTEQKLSKKDKRHDLYQF
ncbi:hypothetical protein GV64_19310 [Endozoicomonas elysicola]|uniref:Uncharacterized protein n=1 Tax=Endozoicomonas elysicola TaxID=305900 RepID=A0A081KEL5_9GAMM|nr:hypothetical protein GV64_19310 [Endozoicomonas elysicola]